MSVARLAAIHRALLPQTRVVAPVVALVLAAGLLGGVIGSAGASSDHAKLASLQRMIALSRQDVRGVQAANTTLAGELADVRVRELALQRAAVQAGTRERTTASGAPADQRHHRAR